MREIKNFFGKRFPLISIICLMALGTCSCTNDKNSTNENVEIHVSEEDEISSYIENNFGFADNPVYGRKIAHTESSEGMQKITWEEELDENSNEGAVFYKSVNPNGNTNGLICVYLTDNEDKMIGLNAEYIYDYKSPSGSYTISLGGAEEKSRCYAIINDKYLASINITEQGNEIYSSTTSVGKSFNESIKVYEMTGSGLEEIYSIDRELKTGGNESKICRINKGATRTVYADGCVYKDENAEFVSTQQEFCNQANELLKSNSIDAVSLKITSWDNRWFGMEIDESRIGKDMVKADISFTDVTEDENGDEITNIVIAINSEKEEQAENPNMEEIDDSPVIYGEEEDTPQNNIIMPDNIPQSIDPNELQDLRYFSIDGFWHSSDYRYVYYIYTQHPEAGFATLRFADLEGKGEVKSGQVKQTSSYSVVLKALESGEFSPEVFAVNGQLKSDEITLEKVDAGIASAITGSWSDGSRTYTFDGDGTYRVKTSRDSYWGRYFVVDETTVVLGKQLDDLRQQEYKVEENVLIIGNYTLTRQ